MITGEVPITTKFPKHWVFGTDLHMVHITETYMGCHKNTTGNPPCAAIE